MIHQWCPVENDQDSSITQIHQLLNYQDITLLLESNAIFTDYYASTVIFNSFLFLIALLGFCFWINNIDKKLPRRRCKFIQSDIRIVILNNLFRFLIFYL